LTYYLLHTIYERMAITPNSLASQLIIGVDPGFKGALALLGADGSLIAVEDMPIISAPGKHKLGFNAKGDPEERVSVVNELDNLAVRALLAGWQESADGNICLIGEKVWARPSDGKSSAGKLLYGAGIAYGIAIGLGVAVTLVSPQTWKTSMHVSADKDTSIDKARALFPDMVARFKRKMDDGREEAALIGWWGWRQRLRQNQNAQPGR